MKIMPKSGEQPGIVSGSPQFEVILKPIPGVGIVCGNDTTEKGSIAVHVVLNGVEIKPAAQASVELGFDQKQVEQIIGPGTSMVVSFRSQYRGLRQ